MKKSIFRFLRLKFILALLLVSVFTAHAQTLITADDSTPTDLDRFIELSNLQKSPIQSFQVSVADIALKFGEPTVTNERLNRGKSFDLIGKEIVNNIYDDNGSLSEQQSYVRETNSEHSYSFDAEGNILKRFDTDYNQYGDKRIWSLFEAESDTFTWQYTYVYDAVGLPLNVTKYLPDGTVDELASFDYDTSGNKVTEAFYRDSGKLYKLKRYSYTGDLLTQEDSYDGENALTSRTKFTHDENGNVLSVSKFVGADKLLSQSNYEYDENNNRTKEQELDAAGELIQQTNFSFDADGNKLSETLYDSEGNQILEQSLDYNDAGQLLEKFYYNADGTIDRGFEYSYNEAGDLLETKNYIFGGAHFSTDVCEYKQIDAYGNWTERNCVLFKRVSGQFQADYGVSTSEVTLRKIEYFE